MHLTCNKCVETKHHYCYNPNTGLSSPPSLGPLFKATHSHAKHRDPPCYWCSGHTTMPTAPDPPQHLMVPGTRNQTQDPALGRQALCCWAIASPRPMSSLPLPLFPCSMLQSSASGFSVMNASIFDHTEAIWPLQDTYMVLLNSS